MMTSRNRFRAALLMALIRLQRESVMHSSNNRVPAAAVLPSRTGFGKATSIMETNYVRHATAMRHMPASQSEFYLIIIASLLFTAFATFLTLLPVFL